MKTFPDNLLCEICKSPATAELHDSSTQTNHLYCRTHRPDLWPGTKDPQLSLVRYRYEPGSIVLRLYESPEDSVEHKSLRYDMCEMDFFGGFGACLYYLSKLTESNQFALWDKEALDNIREYIDLHTNGAAAQFSFDGLSIGCVAPFLKLQFHLASSNEPPKQSKEDRALILLLNHPTWSDERIAAEIPTTVKQLQRQSKYNSLKRCRRVSGT